jgi:hypothetical protein
MALKIKMKNSAGRIGISSYALRFLLIGVAAVAVVFLAVSIFFYYKYQGIVDARLQEPLFANTAKIYAAPRQVRPGQKLSVQFIVSVLREAGYTADGSSQFSRLGTFSQGAQSVTIRPGPTTPRMRLRFTSAMAKSPPSPTTADRPSPATSLSRCSSPASARTRTAPSAACLPTKTFHKTWCTPLCLSRIAASSNTAA